MNIIAITYLAILADKTVIILYFVFSNNCGDKISINTE